MHVAYLRRCFEGCRDFADVAESLLLIRRTQTPALVSQLKVLDTPRAVASHLTLYEHSVTATTRPTKYEQTRYGW